MKKGGKAMKIIRLENTSFGYTSFREDEVDKLVEFDSESGALKVYTLQSPQRVPFSSTQPNLLGQLIGQKLSDKEVRIVHNPPVLNAYSAPFKIYLDITQMCSFQCPFCLSKARSDQKTFLSVVTIEKLATEIKELGVMYVKIGGGDPFLHPDFETIVNLLCSAGCFLTISTNSVTVSPQIVDLLANAKIRTSVSIEGMEVVNDSLRGSGHFRKTLVALAMLKKGGVNVLLRTTLLRQNLDDVPELVKLARSRGVKIKFSDRQGCSNVHNARNIFEFAESNITKDKAKKICKKMIEEAFKARKLEIEKIQFIETDCLVKKKYTCVIAAALLI